MADRDVMATITKLRDAMPGRAIDATYAPGVADGKGRVVAALCSILDDLAEECRLLELAKLKGATGMIKQRREVIAWTELFLIKTRDYDENRAERLHPSLELLEHRPSELGTPAAQLPGSGSRCASGNVHDRHTTRCACGYTVERDDDAQALADDVKAYLSGASDQLDAMVLGPAVTQAEIAERYPPADALDDRTVTPEVAREIRERVQRTASSHRCPKCDLEVEHDTSNVACPHCTASARDAAEQYPVAGVLADGDAEQDAHRKVHQMTQTFPIPGAATDPFAPVPTSAAPAPVRPPGRGMVLSEIMRPVDPALIPAHLSHSQLTSVGECGLKWLGTRVLGVAQVPQLANIGGQAFHACVETVERSISAPESAARWDPTSEDSRRALWLQNWEYHLAKAEQDSGMSRERFRVAARGKENLDWWRVEGELMVHRYVAMRRAEQANVRVLPAPGGGLMLEWETAYDVETPVGTVPFKTVLDSAWVDANEPGTAIIRDWKTGASKPDRFQLATQALGLRRAGWSGPIRVQFWDARTGEAGEMFDPFEAYTPEYVAYRVGAAEAKRRAPILAAEPNNITCASCPIAWTCPVGGRS